MSVENNNEFNSIGINVASFLPRSLVGVYLPKLAETLAEDGYDFLSVLPIRSLDSEKTRGDVQKVLPIWFVEKAWNPTDKDGLAGVLEFARGVAAKDPLAPKIHDVIAFPGKKKSDALYGELLKAKSDPIAVVHNFVDAKGLIGSASTIVEVNPGMNMDTLEILEEMKLIDKWTDPSIKSIKGVDLDTNHIRRGLRPDETTKTISRPNAPTTNKLGGWESTLDDLFEHTELVDFQALSPTELQDTLRGKSNELTYMVNAFVEKGYTGPIRVEFNMGLLDQLKPGVTEALAKDVHDYLEDKFNQD